MNTLFMYRYRDASNYKRDGNVIFSGEYVPNNHLSRLYAAFSQHAMFIAHQIGVPELFFWHVGYDIENDDHCWHEFDCLNTTDHEPTDQRTIEEFVRDAERAAASGWLMWKPNHELRPSLNVEIPQGERFSMDRHDVSLRV